MRRTALLFALLIALPALGQASNDRIADWPGGEAQVMSHSPGGPVPMGQIAADGTVTLDLPEAPPKPQPLGQTFASCREDGAAIATPEDTAFVPTSLFVSRAGKELGALHLATDAAVVTWRASWGQGDTPLGAWMQWVHVDQAAAVTADCVQTTYTDPEATDELPPSHRVPRDAGAGLEPAALFHHLAACRSHRQKSPAKDRGGGAGHRAPGRAMVFRSLLITMENTMTCIHKAALPQTLALALAVLLASGCGPAPADKAGGLQASGSRKPRCRLPMPRAKANSAAARSASAWNPIPPCRCPSPSVQATAPS